MKRAIPLTTSSILAAAIAAAAALATIALVLVASGNSALAASSLVNGNFETGDLTGWTVDTTASGGTASAVASYDYYYPDYCPPEYMGYEGPCWVTQTMTPKEGSYFALLTSAYASQYTKISQPFKASNGDKISGWAFFGTDNNLDYDGSKGQVVLKNASGTTVATPFEQSDSSVGYYGNSGWKYWEYTFTDLTGEGAFQIEARVGNVDGYGGSYMGLDDVKTSTNAPDTTKPSTSATPSVEPNAAGWNNEDVTVTLNATDNQGGWGIKKITYSASGAQTIAQTDASGNSVKVPLDHEGTITLTYYATDKAGNVSDRKTLTVKIDKTAPWVKSTSPSNKATSVSSSAKISVTFLEGGAGIDPATLNTNNFSVWRSGGEQISGTISYDAASKTVTFTPSSPLAKRTSYRAYIRGEGGRLGSYRDFGVWDKADNTLSTVPEGKVYPIFEYTWIFSTGSR